MQEGQIGELTRQGMAAAIRLAQRLGLPHDEPVILSNRGNLDAHDGNLLATADRGWLWIDLEETGRGPAAWDLATMVSDYTEQDGRTALGAYAAESGRTIPALAPFRRVRDLEAAVWSMCMAHLYPARYHDVAQRLLASVIRR